MLFGRLSNSSLLLAFRISLRERKTEILKCLTRGMHNPPLFCLMKWLKIPKKSLLILSSIVTYILRSTVTVIINLLVCLCFGLSLVIFYAIRYWKKASTPLWTKSPSSLGVDSKSPFTRNNGMSNSSKDNKSTLQENSIPFRGRRI